MGFSGFMVYRAKICFAQVEQDGAVEDEMSHVANIGKMVEDTESKMRNQLQEVYFGKTKDIVSDLRSMLLLLFLMITLLTLVY